MLITQICIPENRNQKSKIDSEDPLGDASSLSAALEHERRRRHSHPRNTTRDKNQKGIVKVSLGFNKSWIQEGTKRTQQAPEGRWRPRRSKEGP